MMKKYTFQRSDLFWSDVSVLAQAVVSRWKLNQHARSQLINDIELPGVVCQSVRLENTSRHEYTLTHGQFADQCVFVETPSRRGRPEPGFLLSDEFLLRLQQIVLGHAFQSVRCSIESRFGQDPNAWPPIFNVARHLRNGAFHDNKFDIRNTTDVTWRTLHITRDLDGCVAFGNATGKIGLGDIPLILADMKEELS